MKLRLAVLACVMCLLSGCGSQNNMDKAIHLRTDLLAGSGCSFGCEVTADYGEKIYTFGMDCQGDKDGNLTFSVTAPTTIAGICGRVTGTEGALTFDDKVLAFETIADGYLTPVSAPWVFMKTLRSGYLKSCVQTEDGLCIEIDDTYAESSLQLRIYTDSNTVPTGGEIFWNNRRILTLQVDNFTIL